MVVEDVAIRSYWQSAKGEIYCVVGNGIAPELKSNDKSGKALILSRVKDGTIMMITIENFSNSFKKVIELQAVKVET